MAVWDLLDRDNYIKSERIVRERLLTCQRCPRYYKPTAQCRDCLCFVRAKAKLGTEDCPNGYWKNLNYYAI